MNVNYPKEFRKVKVNWDDNEEDEPLPQVLEIPDMPDSEVKNYLINLMGYDVLSWEDVK